MLTEETRKVEAVTKMQLICNLPDGQIARLQQVFRFLHNQHIDVLTCRAADFSMKALRETADRNHQVGRDFLYGQTGRKIGLYVSERIKNQLRICLMQPLIKVYVFGKAGKCSVNCRLNTENVLCAVCLYQFLGIARFKRELISF